jgi:hypothetical protein
VGSHDFGPKWARAHDKCTSKGLVIAQVISSVVSLSDKDTRQVIHKIRGDPLIRQEAAIVRQSRA